MRYCLIQHLWRDDRGKSKIFLTALIEDGYVFCPRQVFFYQGSFLEMYELLYIPERSGQWGFLILVKFIATVSMAYICKPQFSRECKSSLHYCSEYNNNPITESSNTAVFELVRLVVWHQKFEYCVQNSIYCGNMEFCLCVRASRCRLRLRVSASVPLSLWYNAHCSAIFFQALFSNKPSSWCFCWYCYYPGCCHCCCCCCHCWCLWPWSLLKLLLFLLMLLLLSILMKYLYQLSHSIELLHMYTDYYYYLHFLLYCIHWIQKLEMLIPLIAPGLVFAVHFD